MSYVILFSAMLGALLLYLLATASANTQMFSEHYTLLVGLNIGLGLVLAGIVVYQLGVLARQRRKKVFGSLLRFRVLVMFALVTLAPGALVYTVSVRFLAKSIESWFDVRVDHALEGGLQLGRAALDALLVDMRVKAGLMSADLSEIPLEQQGLLIARMREQVGTDDVMLITADGRVIRSASRDLKRPEPRPPSALVLMQVRKNGQYAAVESQERNQIMRVVIPVPNSGLGEAQRFLQLTHAVPQSIIDAGENVLTARDAYKELSLSRQSLKDIYILSLTLTLMLALLGAVALAFLLSRRLSQPLAVLAEATQAVARGDFSRRAPVTSRDELGILTQSFNSMTEQLDEARHAAERQRAQLETANAYLENILANLSAGVLVFDAQFNLRIANRGAAGILKEEVSQFTGRPLLQWPRLQTFAASVHEEFERHGEGSWQREIELTEPVAVVLLRGSALPAGGGYVVVFDDITQLIAAQRATAWAEVARRLAHEIKNPLTPIRLAAERLQAKLGPHLEPENARTLTRASETIIAQVAALKNMVDEFREYARLPAPRLEALDLNALVREVLALYEHSGTRLEARLDPGLPPILGDRNQLRQVIHNLLQNAQDALSSAAEPRIEIVTECRGRGASLRIADNGIGFSEAIVKRAFEPYVTTKPKGTGLGLAIVKKIIDEHHGSIVIENAQPRGAAVCISLPFEKAA